MNRLRPDVSVKLNATPTAASSFTLGRLFFRSGGVHSHDIELVATLDDYEAVHEVRQLCELVDLCAVDLCHSRSAAHPAPPPATPTTWAAVIDERIVDLVDTAKHQAAQTAIADLFEPSRPQEPPKEPTAAHDPSAELQ